MSPEGRWGRGCWSVLQGRRCCPSPSEADVLGVQSPWPACHLCPWPCGLFPPGRNLSPQCHLPASARSQDLGPWMCSAPPGAGGQRHEQPPKCLERGRSLRTWTEEGCGGRGGCDRLGWGGTGGSSREDLVTRGKARPARLPGTGPWLRGQWRCRSGAAPGTGGLWSLGLEPRTLPRLATQGPGQCPRRPAAAAVCRAPGIGGP